MIIDYDHRLSALRNLQKRLTPAALLERENVRKDVVRIYSGLRRRAIRDPHATFPLHEIYGRVERLPPLLDALDTALPV
jgi:hypothetical protein